MTQHQQGSDSKKKKKKKLSKAATATLNTQSSFATERSEIDLAQIGDCEIGDGKSEARSAMAKARSGNKNLSLQRAAAAPPLNSDNIKVFLSPFPYLSSALTISLSLSQFFSISCSILSDLCCVSCDLRLIFWQYKLLGFYLFV